MATDWTTEQIDAYNDIKEDGFSVDVVRPGSSGTWDDDTGMYVGATVDTTYPTYAIKTNRNIVDAQGTIIQTDAIVLIIPAYGLPDDLDFDANDEIKIDGENQSVTRVVPIDPGNVPILYEVYCG